VACVDSRTREELIADNTQLRAENVELKQELSELSAEVEMLRDKLSGGGNGSERGERKKRTQSFVRKRDVATDAVARVV